MDVLVGDTNSPNFSCRLGLYQSLVCVQPKCAARQRVVDEEKINIPSPQFSKGLVNSLLGAFIAVGV